MPYRNRTGKLIFSKGEMKKLNEIDDEWNKSEERKKEQEEFNTKLNSLKLLEGETFEVKNPIKKLTKKDRDAFYEIKHTFEKLTPDIEVGNNFWTKS